MDIEADDNFFIEEPQKLTNSFFNQDKSIQMVELLTPKHLDASNLSSTNNNIISKKTKAQFSRIQPLTCNRLTYSKKLQLLQHASTMPKSFISRLEILCQATHDTDDISLAKQALDTLISASNCGCCFLEKYIVMLLNFCTKNYHIDDDSMRIKVEELLNRVLTVDFDRQQLTENLRRPDYKITSVEHIIQLLRRVQDMLDYREHTAIGWLTVLLDAYFVDLATADGAIDIIDQISTHIDSQSALLSQTETSRCLITSMLEQMDGLSNDKSIIESRDLAPHYSIDYIEI